MSSNYYSFLLREDLTRRIKTKQTTKKKKKKKTTTTTKTKRNESFGLQITEQEYFGNQIKTEIFMQKNTSYISTSRSSIYRKTF